MPNVYDISEEIEKQSLLVMLEDEKYKNYFNYIIKKDISELLYIKKMIEDEPQIAEERMRRFFKKWKIEPDSDRDNWFAYDLADKLLLAAGKEPIITYEE